jgi:hypothetical protein
MRYEGNLSDLRALLLRAAAVADEPRSETVKERWDLARQLCEAAELIEDY